jgi:hypothetical protein
MQAIHNFYIARKEAATLKVLKAIRAVAIVKHPLPAKRQMIAQGGDVSCADETQDF